MVKLAIHLKNIKGCGTVRKVSEQNAVKSYTVKLLINAAGVH